MINAWWLLLIIPLFFCAGFVLGAAFNALMRVQDPIPYDRRERTR